MASKSSASGNPAKRGTIARPAVGRATFVDWVHAARFRTLPLSVAPVAVGTGVAYSFAGYHLGISLLCLAVAVFLQIGVNFANDYSDGVRGTDRHRVGPSRLTGAGRARPKTVRTVAFVFFGLAGVAGIALTIVTEQWWFLAAGVVCIVAAWFYTGGKHPYGYLGLGELVSFVFFGLVATVGTTYATVRHITDDSLVLGAAVGCFAAATMLVNNIRDIEPDRAAGKRSLATLIGRRASKVLYGILMMLPFAILGLYAIALAYGPYVMLLLLIAVPAVVIVGMGRTARDFITALGLTSVTALLYGLGVGLAMWGGISGFIPAA